MPNITENELIVRGDPKSLRYFYEKNRVSEEDVEFCKDYYQVTTDLSFEKMVPRVSSERIDKLIVSKCGDGKINPFYDLLCEFWGTKWDAMGVKKVNQEKINEGELVYHFETAWSYPKGWLETIAPLFPQLEFEIIFSNEGDGYDTVYHLQYKDKEVKKIKQYNHMDLWVEEKGGMDTIIYNLLQNTTKEQHDDLKVLIEKHKKKERSWMDIMFMETILGYKLIQEWTDKHKDIEKYLDENLSYHRGNTFYYNKNFILALVKRIEEE